MRHKRSAANGPIPVVGYISRSRRSFSTRPDQYICGDPESLMQAADHCDRQSALSVHDLGNASAGADDLLQVSPGQSLLLHPKLDRFDRIRRIHRMVFCLIGIDKSREDVQSVAVARSSLRTPEAFELLERSLVIPLRPDWSYL